LTKEAGFRYIYILMELELSNIPDKEAKAKILENVSREDVFEGMGRLDTIINDDVSQDWIEDIKTFLKMGKMSI